MGKKAKTGNPPPPAHDRPTIDALVHHLPSYRPADPKTGLILQKTTLTKSICHICMYGDAVESYINHALVFPANNPKAFADQITKDILGHIFPPDFHPEFNQYVSISTNLLIEKFEELAAAGLSLPNTIEQIKADQEEFVTHEIDAVIYVQDATIREQWMEIKMFTCPDQSAKVIRRLLQPKELVSYFTTNDYLGLMGFSLICTPDGVPVSTQKVSPVGLEGWSGWMIHLLVFDQGVCTDPRSTSDLADWLLAQVKGDLEKMAAHVGLNKENCFFQMTENFVKVVKMTQIIEEFKEELMQEREAKEREREAKEREREAKEREREAKERAQREAEKAQREAEKAQREAEKAKQRIAELEKELARYKKA
jgi:flagellar biosynthesis GTPase FlhF